MADVGSLDELLRRRQAENQAALVEAEQAAQASGKELFDLSKLEQLLGAKPGDYSDHFDSLRRSYYFLKPELKTLAEFAQHVREQQESGFWE